MNVPVFGVLVVQIEEFKPQLTIGCSYPRTAAPRDVARGTASELRRNLEDWERMAVFYVKACGQGAGSVRTTPVFGDALVRYKVAQDDYTVMGQGLVKLAQALLAAGATEVHSPLTGAPPLTTASQADQLASVLSPKTASFSAIHLHSTVRMGDREAGWGGLVWPALRRTTCA